ncbi:MAG: polyhydroxyalkanoic acid system family protein [Deltaproteobacteria bacterium]
MSRIVIEKRHALGVDEAWRRIVPIIEEAARTYGLDVTWEDGRCFFTGPATGHVNVSEESVRLDARLGFAALLFRSAIERQVREGLEKALSDLEDDYDLGA